MIAFSLVLSSSLTVSSFGIRKSFYSTALSAYISGGNLAKLKSAVFWCAYFFAFIGDNFYGIWKCYAEGYGWAIYPENENTVSFFGSLACEAKFSVEILDLR